MRTVQDELERRDECRYGLHGVKVRYRGQEQFIDASDWDADGNLVLHLVNHLEVDDPDGPLPPLMTAAELMAMDFSHLPPPVPANECVLLSDWPEVCGCWK